MEQLIDVIKKRRSVMPAQFDKREISNEKLQLIFEAANWAPNHKLTEPWRFKVIRGNSKDKFGAFLSKKYVETNSKVSLFKKKSIEEKVKKSSAIVLICMKRNDKKLLPEWEELAAVSMSVQNMWLQATHLEIGGYWSSTNLINYVGEFINLEHGEKCLGIFYLGHYTMKIEQRSPSPVEGKLRWFE